MKINYILTYKVNDYASEGGGEQYALFESIDDMNKKVDEMVAVNTSQNADYYSDFVGHEISKTYAYIPAEVVTKYSPMEE